MFSTLTFPTLTFAPFPKASLTTFLTLTFPTLTFARPRELPELCAVSDPSGRGLGRGGIVSSRFGISSLPYRGVQFFSIFFLLQVGQSLCKGRVCIQRYRQGQQNR